MSSLSRILLLLPYLSFSVSAGSFKHGSLNPDSYAVTSSYMTLQQPYYPPNADCQDFMVPVDIIYDNYVFNASRWEDDYDLTNFLTLATTRAGARYPVPLTGPQATGGVHNIAATFCTPKKQTDRANNVIIATHGIGPARAHWNPSYEPNEYNFVLHAIKEGYSVFFYDRLGCGASDKLSGYTTSIFTAIAVLESLVAQVKTGDFTCGIGIPAKIAVMGFSFGSFATHGAIASTPNLADAVVLTAIGFNSTGLNVGGLVRSFVPRVANIQNPEDFGDLDNGYLTWVDQFAQIWNYFKQPNYDPEVVEFLEGAKAPFAITEFLSLLSGPMDAINFTGPVLAISGEEDYIVCDGYCPGIFEQPAETYYKNADFSSYLQPDTSHHLNFHKNATGSFRVITDFLEDHGF